MQFSTTLILASFALSAPMMLGGTARRLMPAPNMALTVSDVTSNNFGKFQLRKAGREAAKKANDKAAREVTRKYRIANNIPAPKRFPVLSSMEETTRQAKLGLVPINQAWIDAGAAKAKTAARDIPAKRIFQDTHMDFQGGRAWLGLPSTL